MEANNKQIEEAKNKLWELSDLIGKLSDEEVAEVFHHDTILSLLQRFLDPASVNNYTPIGEFFLANKFRGALLANIRILISRLYSLKFQTGDHIVYLSPVAFQWFEDSVILTEGSTPFEGYICRYRSGELTVGIAARAVPAGEDMGPDDFMFISLDVFNQQLASIPSKETYNLNASVHELEKLIAAKDNEEAKYQRLLATYPWMFGAQYQFIQGHIKLDDANIPDFTGKRAKDGSHDIFEIKPPFTRLFNREGEFSTDFLRFWDQAERYLDFVREEKDYLLRHKGLAFDNPRCFLIAGIGLNDQERRRLKAKEKMNPAIEALTYDDLLSLSRSTINVLKNLKDSEKVPE
jgi:hypothetical protein